MDLHQDFATKLAEEVTSKIPPTDQSPEAHPAKRMRSHDPPAHETIFDSDLDEAKAKQVHKACRYLRGF